jgi:hypothetical protein
VSAPVTAGASDVEVLQLDGREVRNTPPSRVLWPRTGFTKRDLVD